ncbi:Rab7L2, Rab7-like protein [Monocercomonoides exilis]|uniref:Rab7L2, Rab7-like protein n=1 Tax=Monocercomonoides exilis TaxID=2049356 RepID=UPI0035599E24|nr:Rab7L2, Rab7-like protein [Monocercomonoides exilis]|eukprot:MONOS_2688.1-p1 / transcript=MONOS_2688.1 / gene=MONOS_2688 / organism=Monocercomonoides_exilis_PA203 / gene_product=Rab7L2, Rab7-like protein / transcript_product=Rab7L2, Rab7-like protein / location=Mono_scaffold00056:139121-139738(-) / protein_length=206 / sequence_SO=supercontig / SO=protein_coding / is_pseudo=false
MQVVGELAVRVNVAGVGNSGTSSLICRYVHGHYPANQNGLGDYFHTKHVSIDGKNVGVGIFETILKYRFATMMPLVFRDSDACALVFSLASHESFDELKDFKKVVDRCVEDMPYCYPFVLIGNKSDQWENRQVSRFEVEDWCKKEGICAYFETSAKTGDIVDKSFEELGRLAVIFKKSKYMMKEQPVVEESAHESKKSSSKCIII